MAYLYAKALHIVAVVSWFAGLFYLGRLFVYHAEARGRPEAERTVLEPQFALMERRLYYGIAWPAMVATVAFGLWLVWLTGAWRLGWLWLKSALVLLLLAYHFACGRMRKRLAAGAAYAGGALRAWNEVPTVLLLAIVFTVVLRDFAAIGKAMAWVLALAAALFAILRARRARRAR